MYTDTIISVPLITIRLIIHSTLTNQRTNIVYQFGFMHYIYKCSKGVTRTVPCVSLINSFSWSDNFIPKMKCLFTSEKLHWSMFWDWHATSLTCGTWDIYSIINTWNWYKWWYTYKISYCSWCMLYFCIIKQYINGLGNILILVLNIVFCNIQFMQYSRT
jgi:hypothetical protein